MKQLVTQTFRAYSALAITVAGFTALWALDIITVGIPMVGYAWFAVAGLGTIVAVGMGARPEETIEPDATPDRIETFEDSTTTGRPLELYLGALAMWAAVSFGWVLGGMSTAGLDIVGYGWLAIAAYGVIVGIGIVRNHSEDVATAVNPAETLETDN